MRLKRFAVIVGAILFLATGALFLVESRSKATADKIFGNMAYLTDSPYFSENVSLVNGSYEWSYISKDNVFLSYCLRYAGKYVYGDFNHDGLKDAAVIVIENSGGNAEWHTVAFLINMAGPTNHVKSVFEYSGDSRWIKGARISAKSFFDPVLYILKDPSSWAYVFERWKTS